MKTLIVEDDFTSRVMLQEMLKSYGPTHVAVNGKEAIMATRAAYAEGAPYELICLDIMMPEMDGRETLMQIRAEEEGKRILSPETRVKIVMTTALDDVKSVNNAFYELADAYLVKPIDRAKLIAELKKLKLIP